MKKVMVMGHGGYAEGTRQNLEMIVGKADHFYFVDLSKEDDLGSFEKKVKDLLETLEDEEVLFVCDLLGATPFRVAATICAQNPRNYYVVTGINTMAFLELAMESDLPLDELADRAIETTKAGLGKFPE